MAATAETTSYAVEGRVLEVCTCKVLCPCWVGENPDGDGTCDSILGWYVDWGIVDGLDVSDRCLCLSVHIPGNVLAGNWRAALLVDDRCSDRQQRALLAAVGQLQPATLNQVAARVKRGAPAISRAIDVLVRAGLVDRQPDPDNRRRLALTLTEEGRQAVQSPPVADASLEGRLARLAHSELRALERGFEILERLPK